LVCSAFLFISLQALEKTFMSSTELEELILEDVAAVETRKIVLYNDEVNTFDFVIESLISVCGHEPVQAEQCTLLVHYKGKCEVKNGEFEKLEPICTALLDRGLTAEIQ
jgi:ATP-dependent Clp protease adaptor protein ClpS